jgi:hypothetical protein
MSKETTKWTPVSEGLPEIGQLCDIWVDYGDEGSEPPHRRNDYIFTDAYEGKPAFQDMGFYECGLYEMTYFLWEDYVKYWAPSPGIPGVCYE